MIFSFNEALILFFFFFSLRKEYPEAFKENNFQRILGGIFLPGARKAAIVVLCFIK